MQNPFIYISKHVIQIKKIGFVVPLHEKLIAIKTKTKHYIGKPNVTLMSEGKQVINHTPIVILSHNEENTTAYYKIYI